MHTQPHRADNHEGEGRKPHLFILLAQKILHDAHEASRLAEERVRDATGGDLPQGGNEDAQP